MTGMIGVGKVIPFPTIKEGQKIKAQLKLHEEEIKLCLDDLESLNQHVVELTVEYEALLTRLCEIYNINLEDYDN